GFAGHVGLKIRMLADAALRGVRGAVAGANRADEHVVNVDQARDLPELVFADLRQARSGDACPRCDGGAFAEHRGIEVGQVFYLGTKYSEAMGATFLGADGRERPIEMGCYGIGITRTVAAAIEQHHDDAGIIWPAPVAPYGAHVVPVSMEDAKLRETAEQLAAALDGAGVDALLDDRAERPGVKFKDADLIGLPVRLTVGPRALARGCVDLKFHDIPNTVARAGVEAARLGVRFFDLHASGSFEMMERTHAEVSRACRREGLRRPRILAVTVLTSLGRSDLRRVGVADGVESQVVRLARLARRAGMDGVVASPLEIAPIRRACGRGFLIVTPGVRPASAAPDDQ